jgi:hypothetical protein
MTIVDPFDVDSVTDYTFDAATAADVSVTDVSQTLVPVTGRPHRRTARPAHGPRLPAPGSSGDARRHPRDHDHRLQGGRDPPRPGEHVRRGLRRRQRHQQPAPVDVIIAGTRTNRSTTNLAARITTGGPFRVRGRVEGQTSTRSTSHAPDADERADALASYTLAGGEPAALTAGHTGFSWVPQHAAAIVFDFESRPFTYRNLTLPQVLAPLDAIPGSAPALADIKITPSGGTLAPRWALAGWAEMLDPQSSAPPFGLYESSALTSLVGWASSSQAGARGGTDLRVTTSGAARSARSSPSRSASSSRTRSRSRSTPRCGRASSSPRRS